MCIYSVYWIYELCYCLLENLLNMCVCAAEMLFKCITKHVLNTYRSGLFFISFRKTHLDDTKRQKSCHRLASAFSYPANVICVY